MGAAQPQYTEKGHHADTGSTRPKPSQPSSPTVYLHQPAPAKGIPSAWTLSFGNRSQREQKRKDFEQRRLIENALILGIMLLVCLLVGVLTFFHVGSPPEVAVVQPPELEAGSAVESGIAVLDQDMLF